MSYAKYERDIVDAYQVVIEGWTVKQFVSPSKWGSIMDLEILAEALVRKEGDAGKRCFWRKLSAEEYEKRQEGERPNQPKVCIVLYSLFDHTDGTIPATKTTL
jgi:hypothetical protein